jgi:hypothetical protein
MELPRAIRERVDSLIIISKNSAWMFAFELQSADFEKLIQTR